jgi:hypothetical protein
MLYAEDVGGSGQAPTLERIFGATKKEKRRMRNEKSFFMSQDQRIMFQMWKILLKKLGRGTVCGSDVVCTEESRQGTKPDGKFLDVTGTKSKIRPPWFSGTGDFYSNS